jgi:NADH:ubiquinone oxidoreductase subunit C
VADLKALAAERDVPLAGISKKDEIIGAIEKHPSAVFPGVTLMNAIETETMADRHAIHTIHADDLFLATRSAQDQGLRIMSVLSASDDAKGNDLSVFYAFIAPANSRAEFRELRIRVRIPKADGEGNPLPTHCPSITDLYPAAGWHEREMYDMYGIKFDGNPDMRRMFLPEGWKGFPMRKDDNQPEQFVAMEEGEDIVLSEQREGSW